MGSAFALVVYFMIILLLVLVCLVATFVVAVIRSKQYETVGPQSGRAKLPPGSMGWPFIGESLQLFSQTPTEFFSSRQKRYGEIFKTHILGCRCIMVANPEAVRYVLVNKARIFKPTYPKSKETLIGPQAIFFQQAGDYHTQIRKLVQTSLSLDTVKGLVPQIESIVTSTLDSWSGGHEVHIFHELKKFAFEVAALSIFGDLDGSFKEKLKQNYCKLDKGYNCFPTLIPGTRYYRSFKARKELARILDEIIEQWRETRMDAKALLGHMLNFKSENGQILSHDQITDNIIGVLFAAQDTTASLLTWIIKYISDDDGLFQAIKEEQRGIYESNQQEGRSITWEQTRTMRFTSKVIQETQRMASIIAFTYREATEDVEYKGYLIPKGWKLLPLFRNIHHNPSMFDDPETFNPSRFGVGARPHTFMPFGAGAHSCPGNELAKVEVLIFIHHLVNRFRWEVIGLPHKKGVEYKPFPVPEKGLPAKFWKISAVDDDDDDGTSGRLV